MAVKKSSIANSLQGEKILEEENSAVDSDEMEDESDCLNSNSDDDEEEDDCDDGGGGSEESLEFVDEDVEGNENGVEDRKLSLKRKTSVEGDGDQKKKHKSEDKHLYKPPTVKELNQLRETENLFHSNLFRLQIQEMLKEVQVKAKYKAMFSEWLNKFTTALENLQESKEHDLTELNWLKKLKVAYPMPNLPDVPGTFKFVKPASISVVGSYRNGCCLGPAVNIDLQVVIPEECFDPKDYLNHRYHRKRALYLAYIAGKLRKSDLVEEMHFSQCSSFLKPALEIKPSGSLGKRVTIVVHLVPSAGVFKPSRFSPEKNNARPNWYFEESVSVKEADLTPTPHYSSTVLRDIVLEENDEYSSRVLQELPNLREGIALLKVWLKQRGLDQGYGSFSGYIMSMYVMYLLQSRRINSIMSNYQVARNTWNCIAQSNWTRDGISLAQSTNVADFHQYFDVVFLDVTGTYNLCADMSKEMFLWVKQECDLAVRCLDNPKINSFQALFMTKMPFYRQFDHILRIQDGYAVEKIVEEHSDRAHKLDYLGHSYPQAMNIIVKLLHRGLQERVKQIGQQLPPAKRWEVSEVPPAASEHITLGLTLNTDHAFKVLDKGPGANLPEAFEFRKFWGRMSEVRRFQDGSICEAVVWNSGSALLQQKRLICRQVIRYLIGEKLGVPMDSGLLYVADQLEEVLVRLNVQPAGFMYGTGEEAAMRVISALDGLNKQLRQLQDIPLDVSGVQGTSPVFRYCETFPPLPTVANSQKILESKENCNLLKILTRHPTVPQWVPLNEGVIHLGISGKWPQDLAAVQRIKAAFYIKIAQGLSKQFHLLAQAYPNCVHILKDGFVFSLVVVHQHEIALLKEATSPEGVTKYRDTPESILLEKQIIHLPKLTSALHGLHQQHPAYGPTCCLAKRWLSSQLLDSHHFPEICIELLVASLFLTPEPYHVPNQPQVGFFRFLHMVAQTNWNTEPVILNLNGELNREELLEIENWFRSSRSTLPALFLSTPYDKNNSIWSKKAPTMQILVRVAMLAKEAVLVIENNLLYSELGEWKQIFRPPVEAYDVVIHLNQKVNPCKHERVDAGVINEKKDSLPYEKLPSKKIPIVNFNPAIIYLQELRDNYGDHALFFYDVYGGDIITVLWKPSALTQKEFKVTHVNCHKPTQDGKIQLNVDAIVEDFLTLGSGIVKSVDVRSRND